MCLTCGCMDAHQKMGDANIRFEDVERAAAVGSFASGSPERVPGVRGLTFADGRPRAGNGPPRNAMR